MNKKKVSDEYMQAVRQIQNEYQQLIVQFGQIKLQKMQTQSRLEELDNTELDLELQLDQLTEKEQELTENLSKEYGNGTINFDTGEFIPAENQPAQPQPQPQPQSNQEVLNNQQPIGDVGTPLINPKK